MTADTPPFSAVVNPVIAAVATGFGSLTATSLAVRASQAPPGLSSQYLSALPSLLIWFLIFGIPLIAAVSAVGLLVVFLYPPARAPRLWPAVRWTITVIAGLQLAAAPVMGAWDGVSFVLITLCAGVSTAVYALAMARAVRRAGLVGSED